MSTRGSQFSIGRIFPFVAVAIFSTQLGMGILNPLLPIYARELGATGVTIGFIAAAYSISRALCMPPFGWLSDRKGRKIFLIVGLSASSLLSFGYALAPDVNTLTLVRLLHGIFSAMVVPVANAYVGDLAPVGQEGRWMGYASSAFFVGMGTGPMLGGFVADRLGIDWAFYAQGIFNVIAFLSVLFFVPETHTARIRSKKPVPYLKMFGSNTMRGILSYRVIYEASMHAVSTFLPLYVALHLGMGKTEVGILIAVNLFTSSLLQIVTGRLSDRLNRRFMVTFLGMFTFLLISAITFADAFWMLVAIMVLRGISSSFSMPSLAAINVAQGREFGMASVQSINGFAISAGMAVGPIMAGLVSDAWDINVVFYYATGLGIAGTIIFYILTRSYQQPARPKPDGKDPVSVRKG